MFHDEWLLVTFQDLLHIIQIFCDFLKVAFLVVFLIKPIAQTMTVITLRMQAPIVIECLPIAMFLAFSVVTVQGLTGHDKAFSISDDFTQQASGIKDWRNTFFKTILISNILNQMPFFVVSPPLPLFHVIHIRLHKNILFTVGKARSIFQVLYIIYY